MQDRTSIPKDEASPVLNIPAPMSVDSPKKKKRLFLFMLLLIIVVIAGMRRWQLHMYEQVHALAEENWSKPAIAQHLHLHPHTVRKYLRMDHFVDQRHSPHPSPVEPYRAYLGVTTFSPGKIPAKQMAFGTVGIKYAS